MAADPLLYQIEVLGETLDDLEKVRVAIGNRIGAAERENLEPMPHLADIALRIGAIEHLAELELKRAWRKHPLAPWAKGLPGIGEKQIARLIAAIGDPTVRPIGHFEEEGEGGQRYFVVDEWVPRSVGQLWAYCGHGDPDRKKHKGMTQLEAMRLGSPVAKMRVRLVAGSCIKQDGEPDKNGKERPRSPYRDVYDARKARTVGKLHEKLCPQCGPAGKPAPVGSGLSDGHRHADALRIVGKEFLKDLWIAAQAIRTTKPRRFAPAPDPEAIAA